MEGRKFPRADRKPCVTFGFYNHPVILDSRPFLACGRVGAVGLGAAPGTNRLWLQPVDQAGGSHSSASNWVWHATWPACV